MKLPTTERRGAGTTGRKLAEEGAARLAAIVEFSDDAIIGKNLDGIVTSWNAGAEKIFGYTAPEMVGQPILKLIPRERQHEEEEILTKIRRGESVRHFDTVRQRKDGATLEVSVTVSPIKDATGRIIGVSKIARDISERSLAAKTLRETKERMRLATEATAVGLWEWNLATNEVRWDAQMFRIYGIVPTPDGLVKYDVWRNAVLPEDISRQEEILQETIRQLGRSSREFRILRHSDGECRHIQAVDRVSLNRQGQADWLVGTNLDITERKRMELALQESEERFRTMANSMSQLAWIARADGFIFWYNRRWYEYTGTTPEQMEGGGWQSVHHPEMLPKVMAEWQAAIDSGEPFDMEFPLRGADGKFRNFLTRGLPLKDATGRVVQWFGTNTDVDELKQVEEKVRRLNAELEQRVAERTAQLEAANKELEAFSYSVSHDLRAPLRAVNGFAGMVLAEFGAHMPEAGKHYLERIQKGGVQMGVLIDDLLAFSRLGRQSVAWQTVDVGKLVQAAWEELKPQRESREIELRTGDLPKCQGDLALLKQVWINLLSNAVKYTQGRTLAVIEIGCTHEPGEDVYFVRDNGAGFDMRFVHKLFSVFQRLHRNDEFEGTGVGLAIVQRIIHRHGGRVWAQAELDRGATFYFTLEPTKLS